MFPKEVLGFPPKRDIDFTNNLAPGVAPTSKVPYKIFSPELIELKMKFQVDG